MTKEMNEVNTEATEVVNDSEVVESYEDSGMTTGEKVGTGAILIAAGYGAFRFVKDVAIPKAKDGITWIRNKHQQRKDAKAKQKADEASKSTESNDTTSK